MSSQGREKAAILRKYLVVLAVAANFAANALAQYPGRVAKTDKPVPVLRAVGVLEWTGEAGKPSASRLVPVAVFDGEQLNDGTIYMTRPEPLAIANGVEYELQAGGRPMGLFDVFGSGREGAAWVGVGTWKPLTAPEVAKAESAFNTSSLYGSVGGADDDQPVLKRKHPKGTDSDDGSVTSSGNGAGAAGPKQTPAGKGGSGEADADRPTLKRKSGDGSGSGSASGPGASSSSTADTDPDRPTLRRSHHSADAEMAQASNAPPDPDRPRLKRGKPSDLGPSEAPQLEGLPPDMQQAVAVSDGSSHTEHPWKYTWANPADETKMKETLEAMARTALGLDTPPAPAKPARKTAAGKKVSMLPAKPPEPPVLADEQFRVFELAYGATATMVLTASSPVEEQPAEKNTAPKIVRTPGNAQKDALKKTQVTGDEEAAPKKSAPQKYVTLVVQPDLYGGLMVLYKSTTDAAHLDDAPRMRLVDAVDAMADNRGELLFELRGKTQRQFALFRVLRGSAEQLFATGAMP